jgi:hypothetical protein
MFQSIGAYLDCILFLGAGLFCLLAPPSSVRQEGGPEEVKKRLKIFRIAGVILLIIGILFLAKSLLNL